MVGITKIDPQGTSQSIFTVQEYLPWTSTWKLLFERHNWNQSLEQSENLRGDIF